MQACGPQLNRESYFWCTCTSPCRRDYRPWDAAGRSPGFGCDHEIRAGLLLIAIDDDDAAAAGCNDGCDGALGGDGGGAVAAAAAAAEEEPWDRGADRCWHRGSSGSGGGLTPWSGAGSSTSRCQGPR